MLEKASRRGVRVAVVGAGVVGCAVASALARRGVGVMVLEREPGPGRGVTSRNSGVIHSGVFGLPRTRKARACVEGNARLYAWAAQHDVPHRRTGKLILARTDGAVGRLETLERTAAAHGVETRMLAGAEVQRLEPAVAGPVRAALSCPTAGIIDPYALTRSLQADAESHGASFAFRAELQRLAMRSDSVALHTARGPLDAEWVVNAAGLHADVVAAFAGLRRPILPCRGHYFRWRNPPRIERLIYPALAESEAGLGIHLTLELDGAIRVGPDVEWVLDKSDSSPAPHRRPAFTAALEALLGAPVDPDALHYDGCGTRPKRSGPGEAPRDFEILAHERAIHLLGIESPGLTAALALAREVADYLAARVG